MFCPKCGFETDDSFEFCPKCGNSFQQHTNSTNKTNLKNSNDFKDVLGASNYADLYIFSSILFWISIILCRASIIFIIVAFVFFIISFMSLFYSFSRDSKKLTSLIVLCVNIFVLFIATRLLISGINNKLKEPSVHQQTNTIKIEKNDNISSINQENNYIAETEEVEPETELIDFIPDEVDFLEISYKKLMDKKSDYINQFLNIAIPIDYTEESDSKYVTKCTTVGKLDVYVDNFTNTKDEYLIVQGKLCKSSTGSIILKGFVIDSGENAKTRYFEETNAYNVECLKNATNVTYDDLYRYPDTYKGKLIKIKVKITNVEPDGLIFDGTIWAVEKGTNNTILLSDEREVREPRLANGDIVTIYGYGKGLNTVVQKEKQGYITVTKDKYERPFINIFKVEF